MKRKPQKAMRIHSKRKISSPGRRHPWRSVNLRWMVNDHWKLGRQTADRRLFLEAERTEKTLEMGMISVSTETRVLWLACLTKKSEDVAGNDGEARTQGLRGQRKNRAFILREKVTVNEPCRCLSLHSWEWMFWFHDPIVPTSWGASDT